MYILRFQGDAGTQESEVVAQIRVGLCQYGWRQLVLWLVGLENVQADADFISEMIKARLDPVPEVQLIPIEHEGRTLLEVKVKAGVLTPYYYYQDGTRRLL